MTTALVAFYCTQCGEQATPKPSRPSLDDRYAVADCPNCGHMDSKLDKLVPAVVQAIGDPVRARELARKYQDARRARLHREHEQSGKLARGCAACDALAEDQ